MIVQLNPASNPDFDKYPLLWFAENMGTLPDLFQGASSDPATPIHEGMRQRYGFPIAPLLGGTYGADGVYFYPEDPPLAPLVLLSNGETTVYIYQYGMVSIQEPGQPIIMYRMD